MISDRSRLYKGPQLWEGQDTTTTVFGEFYVGGKDSQLGIGYQCRSFAWLRLKHGVRALVVDAGVSSQDGG